MTLGELRSMLEDFPDDYKVRIDMSGVDFYEEASSFAVYFDIVDVDDNSTQTTVYIVVE